MRSADEGQAAATHAADLWWDPHQACMEGPANRPYFAAGKYPQSCSNALSAACHNSSKHGSKAVNAHSTLLQLLTVPASAQWGDLT